MKNWLIDYHQNPAAYPYTHSSRDIHYIPVKFHIVGKSDGSGYYRLANLWDVFCQLNQKYTEVGFYFYLYGDIDYINNDDYYVIDFSSGDAMMQEYNVDGVANVYLVNDAAGYCGYYTWGSDAVAITTTCNLSGSTTLAHELGHYFSLPHPFDNVTGNVEFVNETNCSTAGDLFCDTKADFLNFRWSCPYTGSQTDPNGDVYHPDETLFMSYAADECETRFSDQQMDAMVNKLLTGRQDLLNHPTPVTTAITDSQFLSNPDYEQQNIPNDWVELKWKPVANAEFYHLEVTFAPNFSGPPTDIDQIVYGTAYTTALLPDKKYKWRVRPLSHGYTCSNWSLTGIFYTVMGTGIPAMNASSDRFQVFPTLLGVGSPLNILSSAEQNVSATVRLISMEGQEVYNGHLTTGEDHLLIPTKNLSPGMYLVDFISEEGVFQQKVSITR